MKLEQAQERLLPKQIQTNTIQTAPALNGKYHANMILILQMFPYICYTVKNVAYPLGRQCTAVITH